MSDIADFQGAAPIAAAFAGLLQANLPGVITALNSSYADAYTLALPAQYLDYLASPSEVLGGTPIVACGEGDGPSVFEDDLQTSVTADHPLLIVIYLQNADRKSLGVQLRRYMQAILQVVNTDRKAYPGSVTATEAGVWGTRLTAWQPGPMLADMDPTGDDQQPPRSWLSWSCLAVRCKRTETG